MNKTINSASLSSTSVRRRNFASSAAPDTAGDFGWRSEAFAEDLFADASKTTPRRRAAPRWQGVLQCVLPLAVAALGGIVAYLNTLA